jgi:membrane protein YdbS with pleckstrin-like domain
MRESPSQFSRLELWMQRVFRVPPTPQPPEGSPQSIEVFRAGRNYYTWRMLVWGTSHLTVLILLVVVHQLVFRVPFDWPEWAQITWQAIEWLAVLAFVSLAVFSFVLQRLNYDLRWYIVTDRSLRIRSGIVSLRELTMTFSNIQEIRITAGPIQNFLGIADVEVQAAGGGSGAKDGGGGHIGRFEGVSNANAIRDLMVERLRQYRDSGLGEGSPSAGHSPDDALEGAREVLFEARALRQHLTSGR